MFDPELFQASVERDGFAIIPSLLDVDFVKRCRVQLEDALAAEVRYHGGADYPDRDMVLLCSLYGGAFLDLFDNTRLISPFEAVLGPGCTVYAYTSSSMRPQGSNYSRRVHVDCPRLIPGYVTNVGATILLDDFTEDNGATFFLPGSHTRSVAPSEAEFYRGARRLIAPAGTVFFFNARLFHAGGVNSTPNWRHALTINMCRPFMKQRIDIPRAMAGMDLTKVSENVLQKLGFRAQVPASYAEYYAPLDQRPYSQPVE